MYLSESEFMVGVRARIDLKRKAQEQGKIYFNESEIQYVPNTGKSPFVKAKLKNTVERTEKNLEEGNYLEEQVSVIQKYVSDLKRVLNEDMNEIGRSSYFHSKAHLSEDGKDQDHHEEKYLTDEEIAKGEKKFGKDKDVTIGKTKDGKFFIYCKGDRSPLYDSIDAIPEGEVEKLKTKTKKD
jgi:hypothetical protein